MEYVKFTQKPKLKNPRLIVAWPGMGEVAFKAASYLVEKLGAQEFASLSAEEFFYLTGSIIQEGRLMLPKLPDNKFYFWKNAKGEDLVIFLSNAQPDLAKAEDYFQRIISVARAFKVKSVASFAAMPQATDHTQVSKVWVAATSVKLNNELKKYSLNFLNDGQISGMNGLFLGLAKRAGFEGFCLLGEIPLYTIQIENPKASYAVLEVFTRIMNIKISFKELLEQVQTMEAEINKLLDYFKSASSAAPIGEEEIERIKKTLSHLTKLPVSVKDRIEKLFLQAKGDIAKAQELKAELDKWNAYKDYEDRFLDLFRRRDEKSN
ncbi:MAG: PAC2 family protein [Candidatus Omnitrophica bacterium]|nr:PAC2 family protein [Candidatus Omnitrophota bacterium]